ncbi:hypothetical protein KJ742_04970 [Patescibacteria group bacterium]|nr:hypothetical protein [Patescibacteria group bacterium]MBU1683271.1 hypothetical protein [Patescibacteria group bacterium]MBU1934949.1 hypothetical protein [Patescibacteria group bacterium]
MSKLEDYAKGHGIDKRDVGRVILSASFTGEGPFELLSREELIDTGIREGNSEAAVVGMVREKIAALQKRNASTDRYEQLLEWIGA